MPDNLDEILVKLSGLFGAIVSTRFLNGNWIERVTFAASGATLSYFAALYAAQKTGMPEGLAGFLLGLFGMAIVSKAWEWFQAAALGEIAIDWIRKVLGLPPLERKP